MPDATSDIKIVTSIAEARDMLGAIRSDKVSFAFDTETRGLKLETATVIGLSVSCKLFDAYFPLTHHEPMRPPRAGSAFASYEQDIRLYEEERAAGVSRRERKYPRKPKMPPRLSIEEQVADLPRWAGNLPEREFWTAFVACLKLGPDVLKGAHNSPYDLRACLTTARRLRICGHFFPVGLCDSLLIEYALSSHLAESFGGLDLDTVAKKFLGTSKDEKGLIDFFLDRGIVKRSPTTGKLTGTQTMKGYLWCAPPEVVGRYCALDAILARRLIRKRLPVLRADKGCTTLYERELALVETTILMESAPKHVDLPYVHDRVARGTAKLAEMEARICEIVGSTFNPGSDEQLGGVLAARGLKLPWSEATQKAIEAGGKPVDGKIVLPGKKPTKVLRSTSEDALEPYVGKDAVVDALIDWRNLGKRVNTDLAGVLRWSYANGTIYPGLKQTTARTGRYGSSDPNAQNWTRDDDQWAADFSVRRAYLCSPGRNGQRRLVLSIDLKQIEPRLTAHLSQDANLIRVYHEGRDVYVEIGKHAFNLDHDLPDKEWKARHALMRQAAKALVLAILYGAGPRKTAWMIAKAMHEAGDKAYRCTLEDAEIIIARVEARFPRIWAYRRYLEQVYEERGFVRNPFGRKLYLAYADKTYTLLNAMVQSAAADLFKQATLDSARRLRNDRLDCKLFFSVHDELLFDVAAECAEESAYAIAEEMTKTQLRVPLEVDLAISGNTWADLIEWKKGEFPWDKLNAEPRSARPVGAAGTSTT